MARSRDDHLWALAHAERAALAEDGSSLSAEQWRPTCGSSTRTGSQKPIKPGYRSNPSTSSP